MLNWLTQTVIVISVLGSYSTSIVSDLKKLPPQPSQDQISCHGRSWKTNNLVDIEVFEINKTLEPYVKKLLIDSRKAGAPIILNSAYRTCKEQGSLRSLACGTGDYNLYIKPIIECAPPTEPAGRSLHNEGLAVDLACQGYGLFQFSPCYSWIKQNHTKYQLQEHSLEAWHWSTTSH
jgi:hypothetical protein